MPDLIGTRARKPNAALEPLRPLVGEWTTSGTHPMFPGVTVHGRTSFAWQDEGAFLVWRSEIDNPQFPSGIAIFGSDDEAGTMSIVYFDERGISRHYDIHVHADGFTMERLTPKFSQRMKFVFDGDRMTARGTMSRDGGAWEGDLALDYQRVS